MLELYQFELSHYAEKVRLILDYKGLSYKKIEVTPGIGQLEIYRLSGQRQVPVLKDGGRVIADSTAIAKYLDQQYPGRPLFPKDPKQRGLCLLIEEWADESLGLLSRKALVGALSQNQSLRNSVLPNDMPPLIKNLIGSVSNELLGILGAGIGVGSEAVTAAKVALRQDLEALTLLLQDSPYLVGDQPTLADFAVAGLTMYIKFPVGPYLDLPDSLKGKGVLDLLEDPTYQPFFEWRDRLYRDYRKSSLTTGSSSSSPTSIEID